MNQFRPLSARSLEELLWNTVATRQEGLAVLRDRDGSRHGVYTHGGFVVGIHVAGRFDPLLDVLRQEGRLSEHGYRTCIDSLSEPGARCGARAVELAGIPRGDVRDALKAQSVRRMHALLSLAAERGHDARFEPGPVPSSEVSIRMPLGALLPGPRQVRPAGGDGRVDPRDAARKRLRALARRLHPDLHGHLGPTEQRRLEQDLANATAAYHGLAG